MGRSIKEIEKEAMELEAEEQLELAQKLIINVRANPDPDVEEAWRIEIEKRLRDADEGKVKWLDGDEVINRIRRRLDEKRTIRHSPGSGEGA